MLVEAGIVQEVEETEQAEGESKLALVEVLNLLVVETGRVGVVMVEVKETAEVMLSKVKVRAGMGMVMVEENEEAESLQVAKVKAEVETE